MTKCMENVISSLALMRGIMGRADAEAEGKDFTHGRVETQGQFSLEQGLLITSTRGRLTW